MAKIFPIHKVEELAAQTETASILPLIQIVQNWQKDYHSGTLRTDKETDREQGYNQQIFGEILGYKFQPEADWTIKSKPSAQGGQIPDAILTQASEENIQAVIEYKGASISLDKPQQREGHLSPVQQAFKYKPQYRHCPFVIVSNFYEFRLYQDNQLDYEVWTLDDLANPDKDYLNFKTWYYLLKAENFVTGRSESLLSEVRMEQEQISKKFYADYKAARLELLRDIWRKNPETHHDFNFAISKAQKIIDRIVFVCFAEDRGLIPDNKIQEVLDAGEKNPFGLWPFFQGFFSAIDHGSDKLEIPEGYNGGLFKEDAGLNSLKISDEALKQVVALNRYDFIEDLSVSILGHIFEQSISDLEEIKEKVNPDEIETTSKRKKDGIFYTPDYIVRYIVDNALGAYLRENEARIKEEVGLKEDLQDQNYAKREQEAYIKYQDFLQHIKVLDPACGSGAFLVVVFDYLLAENQRVGDILGNDLFSQDDYIRDILANNIYGVDLNEESVEITRLSLWLKTAKKGKKLTALDGNIKCGNSLIDDPEVAGDKAFDWAKEFPDIFATGGFDVVVGNPPYGAKISKNQILNLAEKYSEFGISNALNDTYFAFYALGLGKLLKSKGILGFIAPNTWKLIASARDFRKELLSSYQLVQIVDHVNKVFSDATVDVDTLIVKKDKPTKEIQILFMNFEVVEKSNFVRLSNLTKQEFINPYLTEDDYKLKEKIAKQSVFLKDELIIKNGVKPYEKGKGKPAQTAQIMAEKPFTSPIKGDDSFSPLIGGSSFQRYKLLWNDDNWIQYGDWLAAPREKAIFEAEEKLIFRQTSDSIIGTLIGKNYIMRNNTHIVLNKEGSDFGLKYVLALLNSKLTNWYYWTINPERGEAMAEVKAFHLGLLPLKKLPIIEQETLSNLTDKMLSVSTDRNKKRQQFLTRLTDNFELTKISKKLEKFDSLSFKEFLTELKKAKVSLSLKAQDEWSDYFEDYKADLSALTAELAATDAEIDRLVYQLYELTEEEVKIVEGEE